MLCLERNCRSKNMLIKIKILMLHSHGKSVLSSTSYNLNAWEGYTNDIKQDLAENISWLKVVCGCRIINTVMWRCVHSLTCFTLEQIRRKLSIVNKNTPCSTFQTSELYTPLRLQKAFKAFLRCVIAWYEMFTRKLALNFLDKIFIGVVPGLFRSLKKFNYVSWFHFWIPKIWIFSFVFL